MKVLIISLAYLPFIGGAELAVKEIVQRIDGVDFDMITVNLDGKQLPEEKVGKINVYRIGKGKLSKYFFPFTGFKKAVKLLEKNSYDIVWAIMANQAGLVALRLKKKFPKIKYLLTLQEGDSLKNIWLRTWFIRPYYKAIYKKADFIQAISNYLKQRAIKYGYQGKIELIPNGVNLDKFKPLQSSDEKLARRQKFGLNANDQVLVSASRLVKKNGLDILIKSIKDLDVKLIILGTGKQESKLRALAQELGLRDKVLFFGHVNHGDLPQYLQIADIFVRPSRSEGLGTAFLEAMAVGLPVIATPVGGIPDFLKDKETGLFCDVNNPRDLREKIDLILKDQGLNNSIKTNSLSLINSNYDWVLISLKMHKILTSI